MPACNQHALEQARGKKLVDTMWQMSTPKKKADMPKTRQVFVGRTRSKAQGLAYVAAPRAFYGLVDAVYGVLESVPYGSPESGRIWRRRDPLDISKAFLQAEIDNTDNVIAHVDTMAGRFKNF